MRSCLGLILLLTLITGHAMVSEKIVYGYVERATLPQHDLVLSAKLDTGAKSASLSAIRIKEIEKEGRLYLNFIVPSEDGDVEFTSEYIGKVKIKSRAGEQLAQKSIKRPVVLIKIRLGTIERTIPVNLTNRKRFTYPLLLGRDAIKAFDGIVDPSLLFTVKKEIAHENN